MKRKVKAKVINADWEIRKTNVKRSVKNAIEATKNVAKSCMNSFFAGAGFATVIIIRSKLR